MTIGTNEVQTGMYTKIDDTSTSRLLFLAHKGFMLVVQEFHNRHPAVTVVHIVSKARSIDHSQLDLEVFFFQLYVQKMACG